MKLTVHLRVAAALGLAFTVCWPAASQAWFLTGDSLDLTQRDFRIFNNFTDVAANDNLIPDPDFPGVTGAALAIWKGVAEWGSRAHGTGATDPMQTNLGDGQANFDAYFLGMASAVGSTDDNVISQINAFGGATRAFAELPTSDGWRIRFYEDPSEWHDGPGPPETTHPNPFDLQGTAAHEYGHALGLGHSGDPEATMATNTSGAGIPLRSIEADDVAGLQAIYGAPLPSKPRIDTYVLETGGAFTIEGTGFHATGNDVWFTRLPPADGTFLVAAGIASSASGTRITLVPPPGAGPGDVLVRVPGTGPAALSNAFPFDPAEEPCVRPFVYGVPKPTSDGTVPEIFWEGFPSAAIGSFVVGTNEGPFQGAGILFSGSTRIRRPFFGGTLYVGGEIRREAALDFSFFSARAAVPIDASMVGTTRYYQLWFQDPGDPFGAGVSNALAVTFCR